MKPRKSTYLAHRWIGLFISLQLLAWSAGGFIFSVLDIEGVRGETDARMREMHPLSVEELGSLPPSLRGVVGGFGGDEIGGVTLIDRGLGAFWEIRDLDAKLLARVDLGGEVAGMVTAEQAGAVALDDFVPKASVLSVELIESDPPSEYRGKPLPVYQVSLDHAKDPHIYVDAATGQILARRNRSWRTFDFFWMLHTMDYKGRDNFNHLLLTIASTLAIATSGTGLALWGWRSIPKYVRRRKRARK